MPSCLVQVPSNSVVCTLFTSMLYLFYGLFPGNVVFTHHCDYRETMCVLDHCTYLLPAGLVTINAIG